MQPYYDHAGITIYHGDCREVLPALGTFDLLLTDPPYGTGWYETDTDATSVVAGLLSSRAAVFGYPERLVRLCLRAQAVPTEWITWWPTNGACRGFNLAGARNESEHIAIFGRHRIATLRQARSESSQRLVRANYVHADGGAGRGLDVQGDKETRRVSDVWTYPSPGLGFLHAQRRHPNEKPEPLMLRLVEGLAERGELLVDAFAGSGTTLWAARQLGVRAIGIELEERYCEIAARRLAQEVLFG